MQRGMTRSATAEYLGVSATTVDRWTAEGAIPAPISVAGRRLWDMTALDTLFDQANPKRPKTALERVRQWSKSK